MSLEDSKDSPHGMLEFGSIEEIPFDIGRFVFNPGHMEAIQKDYPDASENKFMTQFRLKNDHGGGLIVDMKGLSEFEHIFNEVLMTTLLDTAMSQINNDIQGVLSSRDVRDFSEENELRYTSARNRLLSNRSTLSIFVKSAKSQGVDPEFLREYETHLNNLERSS